MADINNIVFVREVSKQSKLVHSAFSINQNSRQAKPLHKILTSSVIFSLSLSIIFLGLRNPYLNGNPYYPKQRPRAIIESVEKLSDNLCKKLAPDAVPSSPVISTALVIPFTFSYQEASPPSFLAVRFFPSRASPQLCS
jgi:hypothetical protein